MAESIAEAVTDADVVFTINSATVALRVAEQAAPHLKAGAMYGDLNVTTPELKAKLETAVPAGDFVDVAVVGLDDKLSLAVAGPAAARLVEALAELDVSVQHLSDRSGDAVARTLTRSILDKCLAGVVVDFMWAAEAMGLKDWGYDELLREFDALSADTAKRYLTETTIAHAKRHEIEMLDIVEMLNHADYQSIFVPPTQLIYNRTYHSIKVPFGTAAEQEKYERRNDAPLADW